jgi:hypothetical protein
MTALTCAEFRDLAAEVALGLVAGEERSQALNHLAGCAGCRFALDELLRVADTLLLLSPGVEPEIGFESRVIDRLAAAGAFASCQPAPPNSSSGAAAKRQGHAWRSRRWLPVVAAAAAVVLVASGIAAGRAEDRAGVPHRQPAATNQLAARTALVRADGGKYTCQLVAFPAQGKQPAEMVIHLTEPGDPGGSYQVLAEPVDTAPPFQVGTVNVVNGEGLLIVTIPTRTRPIHGIKVVDTSHEVRYRASFAPI